jgi:hypothetical protein
MKTPDVAQKAFVSRSVSPRAHGGSAAAAHPLLEPQRMFGNQAVQQLLRRPGPQVRIQVSEPGDPAEQEADRIANAVVRGGPTATLPQTVVTPAPAIEVHRKCDACEEEDEEESKEAEAMVVQRKATGCSGSVSSPRQQWPLAYGSGQPLPLSVRAFFEARFGMGFGDVRIHHDTAAAESARAVSALAYTIGQDIVFGEGQYAPQSFAGKRLLAHELTHVVQQHRTTRPSERLVSDGSDAAEVEAVTLSNRLASSEIEMIPRESPTAKVQRCGPEGCGGAGGAGASAPLPSGPDGRPVAQASPEDALRRLVYAKTVLSEVKPLAADEAARLSQALAHAPVYALMRERDEKHAKLKELTEEIRMVEGAQPTSSREQERDELAARVQLLDSEIEAALAAMGLSKQDVAGQVEAFVATWMERGKQIAWTMLDRSTSVVEDEKARYLLDEDVPQDIAGLKLADQHLAETALEIHEPLEELKSYADAMFYEGPAFEERHKTAAARITELRAELGAKYEALKLLLREYGGRYSVLFDLQYTPGSFQTMTDEEVSEATGGWLDDTLERIADTRGRIGDEVKVWDLQDIPSLTFQSLGVASDSALGDAVRDRIQSEVSEGEALKDALLAVTIAFSVLAFAATGGTAVIFAGIAAAAGVGTSLIHLIDDIERYVVQSDAQGVMLDPALDEIFAQGDPQLISIVLDLMMLGLSVGAAVAMSRPIRAAIVEFRVAQAAKKAADTVAAEAAKRESLLIKRFMDAGLNESRARQFAAPLLDPNRRLSSGGFKSTIEGPGHGTYFRMEIPGHPEGVMVKVYPESLKSKFKEDMAGALSQSKTPQGPAFYGQVDAGPGKLGYATEFIVGGMPEVASGATAAEVAEASFYMAKVTNKTIQDLDNYLAQLLKNGEYVGGEFQGLVTPTGNWRAIDPTRISPLPPPGTDAYGEALRMHRSMTQPERDLLIGLAAKNRAGVP